MKKRSKIVIIVFCILLALIMVFGLIAGNYFYSVALQRGNDKSAVLEADHNAMSEGTEEDAQRRLRNEAWFEETKKREAEMQSRDGLALHAYVLEQDSDLWVITCHGYTGYATQSLGSAYEFYGQGYNVLMPDARAHGLSEGEDIGMGWPDRLDLVDWTRQIVQWNPDAQIVLYGVSMGGATVMMAAGEDLPQNVRVIVEDCGYSSVWDEFAYQLKGIFGLPAFPVLHFSSLVTRMRAGWWLGDGDAVAQVAKSTTPILFIHGTEDTFVPFDMVYEVYNATTAPKQLLVAEGAQHGGAASVLGQEYWDTVFSFIGEHLD